MAEIFMKRILVVDDDHASCELLREIFSEQGWTTETAQTPKGARELAARAKFDLVVSDVNLEAEETGLDLLRSLREECPVILVTGFGTLDAAVEASREGAWDLISKPFKVEEVVAAARRAMEKESQREARDANLPEESFTARYEDAGLTGRHDRALQGDCPRRSFTLDRTHRRRIRHRKRAGRA